jgi:hypothetical protein
MARTAFAMQKNVADNRDHIYCFEFFAAFRAERTAENNTFSILIDSFHDYTDKTAEAGAKQENKTECDDEHNFLRLN